MCVGRDHSCVPYLVALTRKIGLTELANPRIQPNLPRPVEPLAFPQVQILDVTGPLQVFATTNDIAGCNVSPYAIHVVSQAGGAVASSSGMELLAHPLPPQGSALDADRRRGPRDRGGGGG